MNAFYNVLTDPVSNFTISTSRTQILRQRRNIGGKRHGNFFVFRGIRRAIEIAAEDCRCRPAPELEGCIQRGVDGKKARLFACFLMQVSDGLENR